jgi:hypothetical protein
MLQAALGNPRWLACSLISWLMGVVGSRLRHIMYCRALCCVNQPALCVSLWLEADFWVNVGRPVSAGNLYKVPTALHILCTAVC